MKIDPRGQCIVPNATSESNVGIEMLYVQQSNCLVRPNYFKFVCGDGNVRLSVNFRQYFQLRLAAASTKCSGNRQISGSVLLQHSFRRQMQLVDLS